MYKQCPVPEGNDGFCYLHTNGDLIFQRFGPEEDSDLVRRIWPIDLKSRGHAWVLCIEALAMGAKRARVMELAEKWGISDSDAPEFAKRAHLSLSRDGNQWCAGFNHFQNVLKSQGGFGATALEAFAELAREGLLEKELWYSNVRYR